jgi:hypothetical protein
MATHPDTLRDPAHPALHAAHDARVRRLWWFALMGALLAGLYIGALAWVTQEVEAGVERSIQPLPLMLRDRPDTD